VLLEAADLTFDYGAEPVVEAVSLAVEPGSLTGVLGPNGSGKTTLLRLLAGTLSPSRGSVRLDGRTLADWPRRHLARRLAVVPQETHLAFDYTVVEIALTGRYPHLGPFELEGPDDVALAREALSATGTQHLERRLFSTLSGGEKQRVVIASALAQFGRQRESGALLLLDEPTASLDLHYQLEIGTLLKRLNAERGITVIVSTHDLNFAASICRDLVLLQDGHVVTSGPTTRVLDRAAVRQLYGVDADVRFHDAAGHLTVVPLGG